MILRAIPLSVLAGISALRGQSFPEYVTGDECLFCHRAVIGPLVANDRHLNSMAASGPGELQLGRDGRSRRLRLTGYGAVAILRPDGSWDEESFAAKCSGCHATAVDPATGRFASPGLDCVVCHGLTDLNHSATRSGVALGRRRPPTARQIVSVCGSCHLRGARWKSGPGPYPVLYVAPSDLFDLIEFDFTPEAIMRSEDPHVVRTAAAVLAGGQTSCLDCHNVHRRDTSRHRRAAPSPVCSDCHPDGQPRRERLVRARRSAVCGY